MALAALLVMGHDEQDLLDIRDGCFLHVKCINNKLEKWSVHLQTDTPPRLIRPRSRCSLVQEVSHPGHWSQAGGIIDGGDVTPTRENRSVSNRFGVVQIGERNFADSRRAGESLYMSITYAIGAN
jgi:hypothetical protein